MISTFLISVHALVEPTFIVATLLSALLGFVLLGRRRGRGALTWLAAASLVGALLLALVPSGDEPARRFCSVGFSWPSWGAVASSANIMLLLPATLFAALALRRPLLAFGAGVVTSALIELVQAVTPVLGRACDTDDLWMNSLGALAASLLAAGVLAVRARRSTRSKPIDAERERDLVD